MIDLATPIDTLPLFNFSHHDNPKKKTSFAYIFFDNYDYLTHLFNIGKLRPVTFDNIQKTILCHTVYHGCDFFQCPKCGKETMVTHPAILISALNVAPRKPNSVPLSFLPWLLKPSIAILSLLYPGR